MKEFEYIFGPRIPRKLLSQEKGRFLLPALLLGFSALFLVISFFLPYWGLTLEAPQYPDGLTVTVYLNRAAGDVAEIDGLNHYIGMRPLADAAELERLLSFIAVIGIALLVVAAIFIHSPLAAFLVLPALLFPVIFLADMYYWLWNFGSHLDPRAPLSSSIKPFVPPVLGVGMVGQFKTISYVFSGFYCSVVASAFVMAGLFFHRRAFKPLFEHSVDDEKIPVTTEMPLGQ